MATAIETRMTPGKIVAFSLVGLWLVIAAFPFLWTFWGSFKVQADFFSKADWTNALWGTNTKEETGSAFTGQGYFGAWITEEFWQNVINSGIVVFFTVVISLTFGTLGGYALARSGFRYAFWLLMAALVFRAMPHITLVSGYLLPFFEWNIWGHLPTTIIVLVAINQPFTLWMLHSFFLNIPKDMDEKCDGRWMYTLPGFPPCNRPCDVARRDYDWALQLPAGLQRLCRYGHALERGKRNDHPGNQQLPWDHAGRRQGDVCGCRRCLRYRTALRTHSIFPASDR